MSQFSDEVLAKNVVPIPKVDLTGKTIIVTGGSSGLGWDTSKHFSTLNPSRIILTCRNPAAGTKAIQAIEEYLGSKHSEVKLEAWDLDFASFKSVKAFADRSEKDLDRLDIVVANAASLSETKKTSVDGLDEILQVNNIANSYLCLRLLPILEKTAKHFSTKTRLNIIGSGLYETVPSLPTSGGKSTLWTINDLGLEGGGEYTSQYAVTKMINLLNTETLSEKAGEGVTVCCTTPGLVYTGLDRNMKPDSRAELGALRDQFAMNSDEGSQVFVAVSIKDGVPNGGYFHSSGELREKSPYVKSKEGQAVKKEIWEDYEKIWADHGLL